MHYGLGKDVHFMAGSELFYHRDGIALSPASGGRKIAAQYGDAQAFSHTQTSQQHDVVLFLSHARPRFAAKRACQ